MWNPFHLFRKPNDASDIDMNHAAILDHFVDSATGDGSPWTDDDEEMIHSGISGVE